MTYTPNCRRDWWTPWLPLATVLRCSFPPATSSSPCPKAVEAHAVIPRMYLPKRQTKSFVNNPPIKLYSAYQYLVKLNRQIVIRDQMTYTPNCRRDWWTPWLPLATVLRCSFPPATSSSPCPKAVEAHAVIPRMYLPKRQTKSFVNNPPIKLYSAYQFWYCSPVPNFQTLTKFQTCR